MISPWKSLGWLAAAAWLTGCQAEQPQPIAEEATDINPDKPQAYVKIEAPEWTRDAVIYQINLR